LSTRLFAYIKQQLFHDQRNSFRLRPYKTPAFLNRVFTVSVGWAPFLIQARARARQT
jgi:hypothetical protein